MKPFVFVMGLASVLALNFVAAALATLAGPTPLADAVQTFNALVAKDPIGQQQPRLTEDAVIAAVRWAALDRKRLEVSDKNYAALKALPSEGKLPEGFSLEYQTGYEPDDETSFEVWSVRLRVPGGPHEGGTTCVPIVERAISSRLIGEQERKVIRRFREEEQRRGIGSFERAEWGRKRQEERAQAAERDRQAIRPDAGKEKEKPAE